MRQGSSRRHTGSGGGATAPHHAPSAHLGEQRLVAAAGAARLDVVVAQIRRHNGEAAAPRRAGVRQRASAAASALHARCCAQPAGPRAPRRRAAGARSSAGGPGHAQPARCRVRTAGAPYSWSSRGPRCPRPWSQPAKTSPVRGGSDAARAARPSQPQKVTAAHAASRRTLASFSTVFLRCRSSVPRAIARVSTRRAARACSARVGSCGCAPRKPLLRRQAPSGNAEYSHDPTHFARRREPAACA